MDDKLETEIKKDPVKLNLSDNKYATGKRKKAIAKILADHEAEKSKLIVDHDYLLEKTKQRKA